MKRRREEREDFHCYVGMAGQWLHAAKPNEEGGPRNASV